MRNGTRRRAQALGTAALALGLAGCGVPPSEVVEVGEPATGMSPAAMVYFLAADDPSDHLTDPVSGVPSSAPRAADGPGSLRGVPRPAAATGTDPVSYAVRQLLAGPTAAEARTLTTALPRLKDPSRLGVETGASGTVVVRLPPGSDRPSATGLRQLACTVARAHVPDAAERTGSLPVPTPPSPTGAVGGPVTATVPEEAGPVEVRVTGRRTAGEPGGGWQVTLAAERCPA
ncbi:hypothetical protein [Streptomyces sp. NPDC046939]|uniref:hypothetical protein n=1 Tax=Streptomyces sp. NPDC046939 TaxID=3155376 RepID=UPI0033C398A4